jgi:hypothetical protein
LLEAGGWSLSLTVAAKDSTWQRRLKVKKQTRSMQHAGEAETKTWNACFILSCFQQTLFFLVAWTWTWIARGDMNEGGLERASE